MQKALTTMNVQLANAISDVSGVTGQAIIRAILQGQRDPRQLAKLRDRRIAASEEEIAHSLEGNWREDILFELQQVVDSYDFHQTQIVACDVQLQRYLSVLPARSLPDAGERSSPDAPTGKPKKQRRHKLPKNQPAFDLAAELQRTMGVDMTTIDGIDVMTTQVILSELGPDFTSSFPTEDAFASWLELAPRRDVSGGKVIRQQSRKSNNRVANALRMGLVRRSEKEIKTYLTDTHYFARLDQIASIVSDPIYAKLLNSRLFLVVIPQLEDFCTDTEYAKLRSEARAYLKGNKAR